jgi:hypothetical protein
MFKEALEPVYPTLASENLKVFGKSRNWGNQEKNGFELYIFLMGIFDEIEAKWDTLMFRNHKGMCSMTSFNLVNNCLQLFSHNMVH